MAKCKIASETRQQIEKHSPAAIFEHWMDTRCEPTLTHQESEDDHLIRFFARWVPCGGGDEVDIMTQFGIDKDCYLSRLRTLALSTRATRFPDEIQELLIALAMTGTKADQSPSPP